LHSDAVTLLRRYLHDLRCPQRMPAIGSAAERESLPMAQIARGLAIRLCPG
jgi:hypothetical protein